MVTKQRQSYYGSDQLESISYLEFGSIDLRQANKTIWAYWQDQEAYDMYMFSRYARDLLSFRDFVRAPSGEYTLEKLNEYVLNSAHNKIIDYLFKYAGLVTAVKLNVADMICESGSSLYGWIDESIAFDHVFNNGENIAGFKSLKYLCSDISELMNKGAIAFHEGMSFDCSLAPTIAELMRGIERLSLFYGLGVSMRYALRDAKDIIDIAQKTELAIFNRLSVCKGNDTVCYLYGSGKNSYVISLPKLIEELDTYQIQAKYCTANMQWG